jgi:Tol biopolymer transport system component
MFLLASCTIQPLEIVVPSSIVPSGWRANSSELLIESIRSSNPLFIISLDDASIKYVEKPWDFSQVGNGCIRWSPDGMSILYSRPGDESGLQGLYQIDSPGQESVLIVSSHSLGCASWSPDGLHYAVLVGGYDQSMLRVFNKNDHTHYDLLSVSINATDLAWSSDGKLIAFSVEGQGIYVLDAKSGEIQQTSGLPRIGRQPIWSPNNQYIAYIEPKEPYAGVLIVVKLDGTQERILAGKDSEYFYSNPMWSPNGEYIAATRQKRGDRFNNADTWTVVLIRVPEDLRQAATK